jgi:hypothetical protein
VFNRFEHLTERELETLTIIMRRLIMPQFTDAMNAIVAAFKANESTIDPAHLASIDASIKTLTDAEAADHSDIAAIKADLADGLNALVTGLAPAAPQPEPTPAPEPEPAPTDEQPTA